MGLAAKRKASDGEAQGERVSDLAEKIINSPTRREPSRRSWVAEAERFDAQKRPGIPKDAFGRVAHLSPFQPFPAALNRPSFESVSRRTRVMNRLRFTVRIASAYAGPKSDNLSKIKMGR